MPVTSIECIPTVPPPPPPPSQFPPPPPPPPSNFPPTPLLVSSLASRTPTRRLQWTKIPEVVVKNSNNVWNIVEKSKPKLDVDTNKIEQLFSYKVASQEKPLKQCKTSSPLLNLPAEDVSDGISHGESRERNSFCDKRKRLEEINLLDFTRSRNVCIFLRSLNMSNQQVLVHLSAFDWQAFDTDTLKNLVRLLPTDQECQLLKSFKGDSTRLGIAERFFLSFFQLPDYQLIAKLLLTTQELQQLIDVVIPAISSLRQCVSEACESDSLRSILHVILTYGNLLNNGATVGCAVGFSISSLPTLTDIKSNDHRTLMHIIAEESVRLNPSIVEGIKKLKTQTKSSLTNISSMIQDVARMKCLFEADLKTLFGHNNAPTDSKTPLNIDRILTLKKNMVNRCVTIEREWKEIEALQQQTAAFFCEDEKKFTLENFINTIHEFSLKFLKAHQDNVERCAKMEEKKKKEYFRRGSYVSEKRNIQSSAGFNNNDETAHLPNDIIKINIKNNEENDMDCLLTPTITRARSASCRARAKHEEDNDELIDILLKAQPKITGSLRRKSKNNSETNNPVKNNLNIDISRERVLENNFNNNSNDTGDKFINNKFVRNNPLRSTCPSNLKIQSLNANRYNNSSSTDHKNSDDYNDILRKATTYEKQVSNGCEFEKSIHESIASGAASFEKKMKELEDSLNEFDINSSNSEQEKIYFNKNNSTIFYENNNSDELSFREKNVREDSISMNSCTTSNVDTSSCSIDLNQTPSPPIFDSSHNDNDSGVSVGENTNEAYDNNQKYGIVNENSKEIIREKLSKIPSSEKLNNKKAIYKLEPQNSPTELKRSIISMTKDITHFQRSKSLRTKPLSDHVKINAQTKNHHSIYSPKPFRKSTSSTKTLLPQKNLPTQVTKHQANDKVPCKPASRIAVSSINTTNKNHLQKKSSPETNKATKSSIQNNKALRSFSEIRSSKETANISAIRTPQRGSNNVNNKTNISKVQNSRSHYAMSSSERSSLKKLENNNEKNKILKNLTNPVKSHSKQPSTHLKKSPINRLNFSLNDESLAGDGVLTEEQKISRPSRPRFNFLSSSTLTSATLSKLNKATTPTNINNPSNKKKLLNSNERNTSVKAHRVNSKRHSTDSDKTPSENTSTSHSFNRSSLRRKTLPYRISDNNKKYLVENI